MSTSWSVVATGCPWWLTLALATIALAVSWRLQERRLDLRVLRLGAVLLAIALVADPALTRRTVRDELPPVAVVMDVSGSMGVTDRHLPPDQLLDVAESLQLIAADVRSRGPRDMAAALTAWASDVAKAGTSSLPSNTWQSHADALNSAAAHGAGYRDAEALCRNAAANAIELQRGAPVTTAQRGKLVQMTAEIATLLPRLDAEQAAGDAALIAAWRAADGGSQPGPETQTAAATDPSAPARVRMLNELTQATRGQLAVRLAREVILPAMSPYAEISTWALAERLLPQAPSAWTTHASDGHSTDFATISELARTWAVGRTPGAVIMISDGRNHGGDPRPALRALAARGARVLTVAVGDAAAPDEPALLNLDGPPLVRVGATIVLQADVRRGRDPTRAWDVVLRVDERIVQRIPVPVSGSLRCQVRGEFPTGVSGLRMCAARLEPAVAVGSTADPSPETSGAWMSCPVRVTDAPLRVLVAEALPRWETRALVAALEADPLCVVERRYLQGPGAVVAAVPVDAVAGADAIILGDLLPTELPFDDQARLAAFVADGGFLAVVAGPRGMPVAFPLGPLADLLPVCVRRGGMSLSGSSSAGLSSLSLTQSGEQHPVTRLLADPDLNRRLWAALPAPAWVAGGLMAAADAEVLAEAASGPHEIAPVVAVRASGGGRVLWMGAPETWRWRTFERGRAQIAFWQQALRWGLAGRPRGADTRLRVAVDPPRIMARGTAEILISAAHEPTAVLRDEHGGTTSLPLRAAGSGRWRGVVADMPAGLYQVAVTLGALREAGALQEADAQNPTGALREERDLLVRPRAAEELGDPSADPQALRALALDCGGHASTVAGLRPALESLARGLHPEAVTTLSSWRFAHGPWLALALIVLLIGEWWWRKRQGLP